MSSASTVLQSQEAKDRAATLRNRARLGANKNLLFWYRELYRDQFRDLPNSSDALNTRGRKWHFAPQTISFKHYNKRRA